MLGNKTMRSVICKKDNATGKYVICFTEGQKVISKTQIPDQENRQQTIAKIKSIN